MSDNFYFYDLKPVIKSVEEEVIYSLSQPIKTLSPKFFYDKKGSELFTQICELEEYYPTRTEISILKDNIKEILTHMGEKPMLIEFGSGASEKIQIILSSIENQSSYMAIDISKEFLLKSSKSVAETFKNINIYALCADYSTSIRLPQFCQLRKNKIFYFSGSSFGNFDPIQQSQFLTNARSQLHIGESFLIGLDLEKDETILNKAYNDDKGITEKFNLNILNNLNSLGNGDFDTNKFAHIAFYNEDEKRIEMHLESLENQSFVLFDKPFRLKKGERIHTENSYKFSKSTIEKNFRTHGFQLENSWSDAKNYFGLFYFRAV